MWVYQETPETAAAKALPEAIMPTAQEEQLKQKNGGVHPETSQDERRSIPAAFSERYENTPERAAVRRSKLSRKLSFWRRRTFWEPFWRVWRQRVVWQVMLKRFPIT